MENNKYYVVRYEGTFGYIKPWTAVRDVETFSQQFLTPSILEGMEKKIFPELLENSKGQVKKIKRYRLNYQSISVQQEKTWSKGGIEFKKGSYSTKISILKRGLLINPYLYLAFDNLNEAQTALSQTLCLCRNEDLVFPMEMFEISIEQFDQIDGFELIETNRNNGFKVGHNRYNDASEMFGELKIFGNPIRQN
jgi:hypothetical protein